MFDVCVWFLFFVFFVCLFVCLFVYGLILEIWLEKGFTYEKSFEMCICSWVWSSSVNQVRLIKSKYQLKQWWKWVAPETLCPSYVFLSWWSTKDKVFFVCLQSVNDFSDSTFLTQHSVWYKNALLTVLCYISLIVFCVHPLLILKNF